MTTENLAQFRGRALVLCINEECREALHSWLREAGMVVELVDSGSAVSARLKEGGVAALFLDRFPPPWPDLDSMATMKRQCAGLKVIVVGDPEAEHFRLAAAVGIDAALPRPLTRAAIFEALGLEDGHDGWCANEHGNDVWLRKAKHRELVGAGTRARA